jgi:aldehyde dehydrogenase (NAD+)
MENIVSNLHQVKAFFATGATKDYAFRKKALEDLREAASRYEDEIMQALYTDLKKAGKKAG